MVALVLGGVGFFYHGFSKESCDHFYWLVPVFKLFTYLTSQAILSLRTYAVSRKSTRVYYTLIVLFVVCTAIEFTSTFWKRVPFQTRGNCTGGNLPGVKVAFLFHVGCLLFDVVAMGMTVVYLWKFSSSSRTSLSLLARMMLEDGIMYFIALSAMNVTNLVFFLSKDTTLQSSASSLGFAVTSIFSARFILHLSERTRDGLSGDTSHSSRTPHSGNRRNGLVGVGNAGTRTGDPGEIVVNVNTSVIKMRDIGDMDGESDREGRERRQGKEMRWVEVESIV
ncbi:hypothetical protein FB45DRAFT_864477 [Roridomyces roridus]|uniref:Uncharacterized protein n=1 Tax=Roridomyces roridus TaxID=1738132 RepID=A0AAD7C167_9AGAR|nr:hypothetical protein FB45DRAFT_864477 [Roridomyces roridus]